MKDIPKDLTSWQKKYGPGFVLLSKRTKRVLLAAPDYKTLAQKAEKKNINREETQFLYVPSVKRTSVFPLRNY